MVNQMHVLAIEGWPTLLAGGQERSLFEVLSGLRQEGVIVTLAYEQPGELLEEYEKQGIKTFQIPTRSLTLKSARLLQNIRAFAKSVWKIRSQEKSQSARYSLIYVNQYFDAPLAAVCARLMGVPAVCHLRLPAPEYLSRQYRRALSSCAKLIANSHYTANSYVSAGLDKNKISVIYNAIDSNQFKPAGLEEQKALAARDYRLVLYLGRITPEKGIDTLIEAMALARQRDPRLRLLVVGNVRGAHLATQEYFDAIKTRAIELLGDSVEFRPATPDVVSLYHQADLVVLPARWQEPFGRVVIEAMACGVPCLASRVGGIPEVLGEQWKHCLFPLNESECLAQMLTEWSDWRSSSPDTLKALTDYARQTYSQALLVKALRRSFENLDNINHIRHS